MEPVTSRHSIAVDDATTQFSATVRTFPAVDASGKRVGSCSATTYLRDVQDDQAQRARPVVFAFNGGPGSSSTPLHLGGLAPRRAAFPTDPAAGPLTPFAVEANPDSLLDVADLVFIDAINTGYGESDTTDAPISVYGVDGDAACFVGVITDWLLDAGRLHSPKYLLGESYGTIRAPLVARKLFNQATAIAVNGIVLLGQALNLQETTQRPTNVMGTVAALPFMAATAWYHGRSKLTAVSADEVTRLAHEYATTTYLTALVQGSSLDCAERHDVARRLSDFIGVPTEYLLWSRLRVHTDEFRELLLEEQQLVPGSSDARYTLPASDNRRAESVADPATAAITPGLMAAAARYYREELQVEARPYTPMDPQAFRHWVWQEDAYPNPRLGTQPSPFGAFDYAACLSGYLKANPTAHLLIGTGLYDSLTTVGMVEHLISQNDLPADRLHRRTYKTPFLMA
ncbi:hypothetical protein [Streptomyces sp. NPDC002763]|uniref:S10 family serine carboxypeptidase-like protein n=1 Tax=Streptomyces sp. NPDC002763 TaxID=3154427 RepID=UPI00333035A3